MVGIMTLGELVEKHEDMARICLEEFQPDGNPEYIFGASGDYEVIFDGTIRELKKSPLCSGDFRTIRTHHVVSYWYVDINGKIHVTM